MSSITTSSHKTFLFQCKCIHFPCSIKLWLCIPMKRRTKPFLSLLLYPPKKTEAPFVLHLCSRKWFFSLSFFRRVHLLCFNLPSSFQAEKKHLKEWNLSITRARNVLLVNKCLFQSLFRKNTLFWKTARQNSCKLLKSVRIMHTVIIHVFLIF